MKGRRMIKTQQPFVPMLIIAFGDHDGFDGAQFNMSEAVCKTYITYGFFESTRPHQPFFKGIFVATAPPSTKSIPCQLEPLMIVLNVKNPPCAAKSSMDNILWSPQIGNKTM